MNKRTSLAIAILLILCVASVLSISGCVTRQLLTSDRFSEPNEWQCKADCFNWCKSEGTRDYDFTFNEQEYMCACFCYVEYV